MSKISNSVGRNDNFLTKARKLTILQTSLDIFDMYTTTLYTYSLYTYFNQSLTTETYHWIKYTDGKKV